MHTVVEAAIEALGNKNCFLSPPHQPHLEETGIYGAEAALDFIETSWPQIVNYLRDCGKSRQTDASIHLPRLGRKAAEAVEQFVRSQCADCEIKTGQSWVSIDWKSRVFPSKAQVSLG